MANLRLSVQELEVLSDALDHVLSDMSFEISKTDYKPYRDELAYRRDMIAEIHNKVIREEARPSIDSTTSSYHKGIAET